MPSAMYAVIYGHCLSAVSDGQIKNSTEKYSIVVDFFEYIYTDMFAIILYETDRGKSLKTEERL